jgi:DDE superfamily endonuclease
MEYLQSTISRAVTALTPLLGTALARYVPVAEDLHPQAHYIIDDTLLPCWSWAANPELYSGKHKTTGLNVQVACTLTEDLAWISDPIDGSRHDTYCLNESGIVADKPGNWIGDKGYVGNDMLTPIKNPSTVTWWTGKNGIVNLAWPSAAGMIGGLISVGGGGWVDGRRGRAVRKVVSAGHDMF